MFKGERDHEKKIFERGRTLAFAQPFPFTVRSYTLPFLFAGKLHALLCRKWGKRVKGRDWYDTLWFIGREVPVHLGYLATKMSESGHRVIEAPLTLVELQELIGKRAQQLNWDLAKADVIRFIRDPRSIEAWSEELFIQMAQKIKSVEHFV